MPIITISNIVRFRDLKLGQVFTARDYESKILVKTGDEHALRLNTGGVEPMFIEHRFDPVDIVDPVLSVSVEAR